MAENRRGKENRFYFSRGQIGAARRGIYIRFARHLHSRGICRERHRGKKAAT